MDIPDPSSYSVPAEYVHGMGVAGPETEPPDEVVTEPPNPPPEEVPPPHERTETAGVEPAPGEHTGAVTRERGAYTEEGVGSNVDVEA